MRPVSDQSIRDGRWGQGPPSDHPFRGGRLGRISIRLGSARPGKSSRSVTTCATSCGVSFQDSSVHLPSASPPPPFTASPPVKNSVATLPGITQDSVTTIANDHGFEVRVDNLSRSDLYVSEEMFVCGTAAEVSAVNSVDDRQIPCPGPMTQVIAAEYARAVRGQVDKYKEWCELV